MRAFIKAWDKEYPVFSISWTDDGCIYSVVFYDEHGNHYSVFRNQYGLNTPLEKGKGVAEMLEADLEKVIVFREKEKTHRAVNDEF